MRLRVDVLASSARSAKMRWLFCACDRQAVRLAYLLDGSRMSREVHVRFCERPGVKHPGPPVPPPLRATGCRVCCADPKAALLIDKSPSSDFTAGPFSWFSYVTLRLVIPNTRPSVRHQLPHQLWRVNLPIVCQHVSLAQNCLGPVVQFDWNIDQVKGDCVQQFARDLQPTHPRVRHQRCAVPAQSDAMRSQISAHFEPGLWDFAAFVDGSPRQHAREHFRS